MPTFSDASKAKLATCCPELILLCNDVIHVLDFTIVTGHRNEADQEKAFRDGNTKLHWPHGNHNKVPSDAVDVAPIHYVGKAGKIDWNDLAAFGRLAGAFQFAAYKYGIRLRFGLDWDGDFWSVGPDPDESFLDAPHIEVLRP